jgi:hypothetical protein
MTKIISFSILPLLLSLFVTLEVVWIGGVELNCVENRKKQYNYYRFIKSCNKCNNFCLYLSLLIFFVLLFIFETGGSGRRWAGGPAAELRR